MHVLLFGASGNIGRHIAAAATRRGYNVTAVVRNQQKAAQLAGTVSRTIIADVTDPPSLAGICKGYAVVISALGKSVSPSDRSKPSFTDIDLDANTRIPEQAVAGGVRKFVYVSAFGAETMQHLTYFRVHHLFSEELVQSGMDYAIIKPPAVFSAYAEMLDLARKGRLVSMGRGNKHTNPIYEGDLGAICVEAIGKPNALIEAGGKKVYTRKQLLELIQQAAAPSKRVREVPMSLIRFTLPLIKIMDRNMYDKVAFFAAVMQHDTIAPLVGKTTFEEYLAKMGNG